ncbi:MAG: hypothetical protein NUW23_05715, partial [Firmicutes bacterium]|nr:hypothetical protein [Bacillota bacterium]
MPEGARLVAGHQTWARHLVLALILAIWLTIALVPQPVTGAQGDPPPSHAHGILTLADAQVTGSAIDVTYGDSFSFSVPLDAGYVISER